MSSSLIYVHTEKCDYPSQPRSNPDLAYCRSLGESMKAIGQQVPIIGYTDSIMDRFNVSDGGCRLEGARLCGISELLAMDLGKKPALGVSDSLVGDYLSLLTLPADVQEQVNSGTLHMSKACLIAQQESNPDRQRELAVLAKDMARKELAAKVRQTRRNAQQTPAVRVSCLRCPLPSGTTVVIKGSEISLLDAINALTGLLKAMKKASDDGIDGSTFSRVCRDKAKAGG